MGEIYAASYGIARDNAAYYIDFEGGFESIWVRSRESNLPLDVVYTYIVDC